MIVAQAPRPVDRSGAEDQCAARRAIERQIVGRDAVPDCVAVVKQIGIDRKRRRGEPNQAGGIEAVVGRFIPLIAEIVLGQRRRLPGLKIGDAGVAPEAQVGVVIGNCDCLQGRFEPTSSTWNICPINAFSGLPPPIAGGLRRGSRNVPVHSLLGSIDARLAPRSPCRRSRCGRPWRRC